jgi:DedD protein
MKPLDDGLKQRLVGAIAILALAAIFLPVIFDRDPIVPVDRNTQIPPAPEIVSVKVDQPIPTDVVDLAPEPDAMYEPTPDNAVGAVQEKPVGVVDENSVVDGEPVQLDGAAVEPRKPAADAPGLNAAGVPLSWVLQVASLREQSGAERLRAQLLEKKYSAFIREAKLNNGSIYRVYVGPKLDKAALAKEKAQIDASFRLDSIILEFTP